MTYVEWLRVRGALKWTSIVLLALLVLAAIGRIWAFGFHGDAVSHILALQTDPGTHVTRSIAPDGARRTVIDDPHEQSHVTIDDYGWGHKHIEILDRSSHDHSTESVVAGKIAVHTLPTGHGSLTVIDVRGIPFAAFIIVGFLVALIFATIVGAPFARENDGHLEIAFTKPIRRGAFALATIGVDAAGIVAAFALGVAAALLGTALFEFPAVTFDVNDIATALLGIVAPFAWYAFLNGATASMKRGYGTVIGFAWPIALIVVGLSHIHPDGNALLTVVRDVFKTLAVIDPVSYMHAAPPVETDGRPDASTPTQFNLLASAILGAGYAVLAIFQWRRLET